MAALVVLGLAILWMIDQFVFQSFLDAIFILMLKLQYDHSYLLPVGTVTALNARKGRGVRPLLQLFYFLPMAVFASLSVGAGRIDLGGGDLSSAASAPAMFAILVVVGAWVLQSARKQAPVDRAKHFGDRDFEDYVLDLKCRAPVVLKRFAAPVREAGRT